jgi:hypothetical protein
VGTCGCKPYGHLIQSSLLIKLSKIDIVKKSKGQHIVDHINFVRIVRLQRLNICSGGGRLSFGCSSFGRVSY